MQNPFKGQQIQIEEPTYKLPLLQDTHPLDTHKYTLCCKMLV